MTAAVRGLGLFVPLFAVILVAVRRPPTTRRIAAAVVASAWTATTLIAVNLLAVHQNWWTFSVDGGTAAGLPVDLLLGWVLLWGTLPALAGPPAVLTACALVLLDLTLMPHLQPVVRLGDAWLLGEALAVAGALVPALLLGRCTERDRWLPVRALAQMALAGTLFLALPLAALGSGRPGGVEMQLLAVPVLLGVAAVREFAIVGEGTPLPYDPPRRLVTSGPYAYVRNPMQLSMALSYLVLGAWDPRMLVGVVVVVAYGAGLAAWHEGDQVRRAHGPEWESYRAAVRPWLPRLRPWPGMPAARVYVAATCDVCDQVGTWIRTRRPVALEVVPAEGHPRGLRRITYETGDGREKQEGIAAVARTLQHLGLGWAWLGWLLLLPGVARAVQLVVDGLGLGPRDLTGPGRGAVAGRGRSAPSGRT